MKGMGQLIGVTILGLITSVLTAVANLVIANLTGFNFFTFSFWVVIPVGAILSGFVAASGYYFGCLLLQKRPSLFLLLQMIVVAGFTQFLIYYLDYQTTKLKDGSRVADLVPFVTYIQVILENSQMRVGKGMHDGGKAGTFGYWLAAIQFAGFLLGGFALYMTLVLKPSCEACNLYLHTLGKKEKKFPEAEGAVAYFEELYSHPPESDEFAELVRSDATAKAQKGTVLCRTILHGCPGCQQQTLEEKVMVFDGREWNDAEQFCRRLPIAEDVDLRDIFA